MDHLTQLHPSDSHFMSKALQIAKQGIYTSQPNPRVGCVIVQEGKILASGFHARAGEGHAEINALQQLSLQPQLTLNSTQHLTLYVTLEPCNHQGKTAACTEAIIQAGIPKVVAAMQDPNPLVAGKGFQRLKDAGIKIVTGCMEEEAMKLNSGFIKRMQTSLPWVTLKLASSLDGRTAMANGESKWITGPEARQDVQKLRLASCAILTTSNTLVTDNPKLNVRAEEIGFTPERQPALVILDTQLMSSPNLNIFKPEYNEPRRDIYIFTDTQTLQKKTENLKHLKKAGANVFGVRKNAQGLPIKEILKKLAELEINDLMLETGSTIAGQFILEGLVDEFILYQAPILMGDSAQPLVKLPGLNQLANKICWDLKSQEMIGSDLKLRLVPKKMKN